MTSLAISTIWGILASLLEFTTLNITAYGLDTYAKFMKDKLLKTAYHEIVELFINSNEQIH
jgi:hypothetical protein